MEFIFRPFKVFRLKATLLYAAAAKRAHSGKGPDYCFMIGRGPNTYLLVHVTELPFCHFLKLFLSSSFISVDFWSRVCCMVLDIQQVKHYWGVGTFYWWKSSGVPLSSSKKVQNHKTRILVFKKFATISVDQWMFGIQWASKYSS